LASIASSCTVYVCWIASKTVFLDLFFFIRQFRNSSFIFLDQVINMVWIDTYKSQVFIVTFNFLKCEIIGESSIIRILFFCCLDVRVLCLFITCIKNRLTNPSLSVSLVFFRFR
jgi:hypothetical protein